MSKEATVAQATTVEPETEITMAEPVTATATMVEPEATMAEPATAEEYQGFSFENINFNTNNGISGTITFQGKVFKIENNNIIGEPTDVTSSPGKNKVNKKSSKVSSRISSDTTEKNIKQTISEALDGTGITIKVL